MTPHTLLLDCDGVILNSNPLKTEAFRAIGLNYGEDAAEALVHYHVTHGGISRYRKFAYFLSEVLGQKATDTAVNALAARYSELVTDLLVHCEIAEGLSQLREQMPNSRWLIVSGGDQRELREVFAQRGLAHLFDGGIHGSPSNKDDILRQALGNKASGPNPPLFVGDSRYDHEVARRWGCAFMFAYAWTEFDGWKTYCAEHAIPQIARLGDLASHL